MARIVIDHERCKGCLLCCTACQKGVIGPGADTNLKGYNPVVVVQAAVCTGCALCARMCPDVAIEVWK